MDNYSVSVAVMETVVHVLCVEL